jgi:hypothetical protein
MVRRRKRLLLCIGTLPVIVIVIVACLAFGCFAGRRMPTTLPARSDDAPKLIHVVGWNGPVAGDRAFLQSLRAGGCSHRMETFDWTDGHNGLRALWHAQRSREPAQRLASRIVSLHQEASASAIDVTADSSGCGVALDALALLPADVRVRTVVLSSPAVSRGYDVGPALARVDRRIINFYSKRDWFVLGLGTSIFATVDGQHSTAAGRSGFNARHPKLTQIPYDSSWSARLDNTGGHAQSLSPKFAREYVARLFEGLHSDPP